VYNGSEGPHTQIPESFFNDHVEMSKKPHQKRPELPGGKVMGST
jgi:hypothetical protein